MLRNSYVRRGMRGQPHDMEGQLVGIKPNKAPDMPDTQASDHQGSVRAVFDIQDVLRRWWMVLTQPRVATFDTQQSGASWSSLLIQLAILSALNAVFTLLAGQANVFMIILVSLAAAYVGFFAITMLSFACARFLGGTGELLPYAYVLALIYVPLQILGAVLGIVPTLGTYISLALFVYQLVLSVYATVSVHRMTMGKAVVTVLIPFVVLFAVSYVVFITTGVVI